MTPDVASTARESMAALHRLSEPDVLKPLLERAALTPESRERVLGDALGLLADLRAAQGSGWVNRFLQEYRLNSSKGSRCSAWRKRSCACRMPGPPTC